MPSRENVLVAVSAQRFAGESGQVLREVLRVRVLRGGILDRPAKNVAVRYTVVSGRVQLLGRGNRARRLVRTNDRGEADLAVVQPVRGYSLLAVELSADPSQRLFFEGATEGVVDQLSLYTAPCLSAPGTIEADISAVDFRGTPVRRAKLLFEAAQPIDTIVAGRIRERAGGRYQGTIKLNRAGCSTLTVQDNLTRRSVQTCIAVVPGPPKRIRFVGETDPRRAEPYNEVVLRARLEDRFGNALDPRRLVCRGGAAVSKAPVPIGDELRVTVRAAGSTTVPVRFADRESKVRAKLDVPFSAVWLSNPGAVFAHEPFRHRLFITPSPGRQADDVTIKIRFDPKQVRFSRFTPSRAEKLRFETAAHVQRNLLTVTLKTERPVTAREFPTGLEIGEIAWLCRREGSFCFSAVARMSPDTPPFEQCPDQKARNRRSLCLNIIYNVANPAHPDIGTKIATAVETIIGSDDNVSRCCPILDVKINYETIGNILINEAIGTDGAVTTFNTPNGDFERLFAALRAMPNSVIKPNCINMVLVPINAGVNARRPAGLTNPSGNSVVDPNTAADDIASVGAHEVGHALGLSKASGLGDINDPTNLMHEQLPVGRTLNAAQCRRIQERLDRYNG